MEIGGKIGVNKKRYGKYVHKTNPGSVSFGKDKKVPPVTSDANNHEEVVGLNGTDSSIMSLNYEGSIKKEPLRLEMQLEKAEKKLKKVKEEIKANELLSLNNERLEKTKHRLEKEIQKHRQEYKALGLQYQVSDSINQTGKIIKETVVVVREIIITVLPSAKDREKLKYATALDKKLSKEFKKPAQMQTEDFEPLLFEAEKLNRPHPQP